MGSHLSTRPGRLAALVLVALLACGPLACVAPGGATAGTKTAIGGLGGAAAGGLLGSAVGGGTTGTIAGVLIGGLLGGAVGNALDQRDRDLALKTAQQGLESAPTGSTSTWINPDNGNTGTFTPTRTYQEASGQYCREYQQEIIVGGEQQRSFGTACRQPDGSWKIQG